MTSDKGKVARQQQVGRQTCVTLRQTQFVGAKFAYIEDVLRSVPAQISTAMFINIHWMEISLQNLFPFFQKSFFFKDCIEEITRFVAAVNNFPWEINSSSTTALHARCTFRRVKNRFQPQTSLWKYENTMLIKTVAMFRNRLFISSFDATIRVKRAFHPALASRGFASHVFLVK